MTQNDDHKHLWDGHKSKKGCLPSSKEAFNQKYEEWRKRNWLEWLSKNLSFPFYVIRKDDEDDAYYKKGVSRKPFRLGHTMELIALVREEKRNGIIVRARESGKTALIPLFDLEVVSKIDSNYWPVREYVVWDANRCSESLEKSMPAKSPKSAKIKSEKPSSQKIDPIGTWRITEMEQWDKEYIDMEGPGLIVFQKKGQGEMLFGCVHVGLDWKYEKTADRIEFSFSGFDEGTEITGRGWAKVNGNKLQGRIFFHQGDESGFKAQRKR